MKQNKIYTTEYYAKRHINYHTSAGLGYTKLVIFTPTGTGGYSYEVYERNNKTGYCKNFYTGKRISQAKWNEMYNTSHYAF